MSSITVQSSGSTYSWKGNHEFEGQFRASFVETGSTATNLKNYGISLVASTTALGKNKYTLDAPEKGLRKTIYTDAANSSDYPIIYSGSTATFFESGSTKLTNALFVGLLGVGSAVDLIGVSTAKWLAVGEVGTVAYSTST